MASDGTLGGRSRGEDNCHMCDAYEGNPRAERFMSRPGLLGVERGSTDPHSSG